MKHEEKEERVGENAQEQDEENAIGRSGDEAQPNRRRFLKTGGVLAAGAAAYVAPRMTFADGGATISPEWVLVPEVDAVYVPTIPPDFYDRRFMSVGSNIQIAGAVTVQIQPPSHPQNPYGYGPEAQFSLYHDSSSGLFTARFDSEGTFHTFVDGVITTVFAGVTIEEDKDGTGKTGKTETFSKEASGIVISDTVGPDYQRWDYYEDQLGLTMLEVSSVADAIIQIADHVDDHGKLDRLTFANHGLAGQISAGDGNTRVDGKWFGKDANNNNLGAYAALVAGLQGKFNANASISVVGCYAGEGAEGQNLVDSLAADIGGGITVKAKKGAVSYLLKWYLWDRYAQSSGETGWAKSE